MSKKLRALLKAKKREYIKIPTELGIVYETSNRKYEVLPYFDVAKKHCVCAIAVRDGANKLWLVLTNFGNDVPIINKDDVLFSLKCQAYIFHMQMPCYDDIVNLYVDRDKINKVIDMLQGYGVKADKLEGAYIIDNEKSAFVPDNSKTMLVYHFNGMFEATYQEVDRSCFNLTRLLIK